MKPTAPRDLASNIHYRQELLQLAETSKTARTEIKLACARDPVFFCNSFLYTFDPQHYPLSPERPFILYPYQEEAILKTWHAIGKHGLIFPKTRRMGVTVLILAAFFHRWCFYPMQSFLLCSAKEDRVDRAGDPSCLFWKLDHMWQCLPAWLRPPLDRAELRFHNEQNSSIINGESTNRDVDRGGVRTAVMADEAASMANAAQVGASIQFLTSSVFWVSTPKGAFGHFYDLYEKYTKECPDRVIRLHWTQHPIFAAGLTYGPDGRPTSPWYEEQCRNAPGPKWIGQELDIGFNAAGGQFFENELLNRLLAETVRMPAARGEVKHDDQGGDPKWTRDQFGRTLLWCPLDKDGKPPPGEYVIGCDIATGKGGVQSSQSTASVVNKATGEKVAEFKHNMITPTNFAKYVVAMARMFYEAKVIWGSQGLGDFGVTMQRECRYARVWLRPNGKPGFPENPESKYELFGMYRDSLAVGRFVNRSKEALEECRQFIYANGTVEHSRAIQNDQDPENKGRLHGDIVVADAMANYLLPLEAPSRRKATAVEPPYGTFAWRMREAERKYGNPRDEWGALANASW